MDRLSIAKDIIKDNIKDACYGIFKLKANVDEMRTIYLGNSLQIDICDKWGYFEVFGLTDEEFKELENFYLEIRDGK